MGDANHPQKAILAITPGDPDGIGPEITWRAIRERWSQRAALPLLFCVGARRPFDALGAPVVILTPGELTRLSLERLVRERKGKPCVLLCEAPSRGPSTAAKKRGRSFSLPGYQSGWSIARATELILRDGVVDALVTGPISKERLQAGGYPFPGHTEFLAELCKKRGAGTSAHAPVTMLLENSQLRVSLVTTHLALKDVPRALNRRDLRRAILHTAEYLRRDCGIAQPRIGVAALNPHAGEAGLFGREELRVISPELRALNQQPPPALRGATLSGPFPADTLFAKHVLSLAGKASKARSQTAPNGLYDAIICMYHDQGLIPVKLLDFPRTVNVSLGLPIVRTSVDHGVAFDIAGTGNADASSLLSAIDLATHIVRNRQAHRHN